MPLWTDAAHKQLAVGAGCFTCCHPSENSSCMTRAQDYLACREQREQRQGLASGSASSSSRAADSWCQKPRLMVFTGSRHSTTCAKPPGRRSMRRKRSGCVAMAGRQELRQRQRQCRRGASSECGTGMLIQSLPDGRKAVWPGEGCGGATACDGGTSGLQQSVGRRACFHRDCRKASGASDRRKKARSSCRLQNVQHSTMR